MCWFCMLFVCLFQRGNLRLLTGISRARTYWFDPTVCVWLLISDWRWRTLKRRAKWTLPTIRGWALNATWAPKSSIRRKNSSILLISIVGIRSLFHSYSSIVNCCFVQLTAIPFLATLFRCDRIPLTKVLFSVSSDVRFSSSFSFSSFWMLGRGGGRWDYYWGIPCDDNQVVGGLSGIVWCLT